jgi:hypothetical protein
MPTETFELTIETKQCECEVLACADQFFAVNLSDISPVFVLNSIEKLLINIHSSLIGCILWAGKNLGSRGPIPRHVALT